MQQGLWTKGYFPWDPLFLLTLTIKAGKRICFSRLLRGAIAQLGERLNGIQEVVGSIPSSSTIYKKELPYMLGSSFSVLAHTWTGLLDPLLNTPFQLDLVILIKLSYP
jgi:hypothetical protein